VLRLAASIGHETVTASLILRKLGSYPRQNSLALALREIGRIERTLFMLAWLEDPALLQHVSPLGWEHINLTGDTWHTINR
jgi:TnpA family transposase